MRAEELRKIGQSLYVKLKGASIKGEAPLARGAGGDKTFPVDKLAEDLIIKGLEAVGEPFRIISEEAGEFSIGRGAPAKTVLIDPVDGSKNAVAGVPFYGASIAVASGDELGTVETAYVINLVNGEEFWAERGSGAFQNGLPARCRADTSLTLVAYEAPTPSRDIKRILPLLEAAMKSRCLGAIALDLAYLAGGAVSVLVSPAPSRPFDYAAGYLLVREAGGVFTDISGRQLERERLGIKRGASILASANRALHDAALNLLNK